jgi:hypothetical protein
MKLYTLTESQLLDLIYDVDMSATLRERCAIFDKFVERNDIPTRELPPSMTAQYSHQNTDSKLEAK